MLTYYQVEPRVFECRTTHAEAEVVDASDRRLECLCGAIPASAYVQHDDGIRAIAVKSSRVCAVHLEHDLYTHSDGKIYYTTHGYFKYKIMHASSSSILNTFMKYSSKKRFKIPKYKVPVCIFYFFQTQNTKIHLNLCTHALSYRKLLRLMAIMFTQYFHSVTKHSNLICQVSRR